MHQKIFYLWVQRDGRKQIHAPVKAFRSNTRSGSKQTGNQLARDQKKNLMFRFLYFVNIQYLNL